ncbi:hypothetical protein [Cribrihabitans neustonicus]|uniref:hypothetical protein n=1 Tax=Cribrihabitans neustonicus TaxID=1429085 RepID=UPI003B5AC650
MPDDTISELTSTITDWIRTHRAYLADQPQGGTSLLWKLWDRLAHLVYDDDSDFDTVSDDLVDRALNLPGGELAWTLLDHLIAEKPEPGTGLGVMEPRFLHVARSDSEAGLLGRVHFSRAMNYLHHIAPNWTSAEMLPRFQEGHTEAMAMWKANAQSRVGSPELFNALKQPLLAFIPRPDLSDNESSNLVTRLIDITIWRQLGSASEYELSAAEVRDLLVIGPARLREHVAWLLWRLQADNSSEEGDLGEKGDRWKNLVGPIFQAIWPLDVRLRTKRASENLVLMVMETDKAFPEAVGTIVDYLEPYQIYALEHAFRLERAHEDLIARYPRSIIILTNALVDPELHPVPSDLGKLLDDCIEIDPEVANIEAYLRLNGFRRFGGA